MNFNRNTWAQLKGKSAGELVSALEKDGWVMENKEGSERIYRHSDGRHVSIHYHESSSTYGPKLLKALFEDIGWSEGDMRRLKLIKK